VPRWTTRIFVACQAMAVVGIVLREVADAMDLESGDEG
jgi:hypothetical protein